MKSSPTGEQVKSNGASGSGKWSKYRKQQRKGEVSWEFGAATAILDAIEAVTRTGDAIIFGTTRDGGSLVITVCSGDDRGKFYATTPEEVAAILEEVKEIALGH